MNKTIKKTLLISLITIMLISTSIAILPARAEAAPNWNVAGDWVLTFELGALYPHAMTLTQTGNTLSGSGYYVGGGYTWVINSGSVTGDAITITAVYTATSDAVGTIWHITGKIAADGTMSGTWDDNYEGGHREGTWESTSGVATRIGFTPVEGVVYLTALPEGVTSVSGGPATYPGGVGDTYEIALFSGTQKINGWATIIIHYNQPGEGVDESTLNIFQYDYLVGDVNKDGKVNLLDLAIIAKAMGSTDGTLVNPPKSPSKNWNPLCDLNSDHKVDLKDVCKALPNFGKTAQWTICDKLGQDTEANTITARAFIDSGFGVR